MPDVPGWERPALRTPAVSPLLGLQKAAPATLPHPDSDGHLGPGTHYASHEADSWGQTTPPLTGARSRLWPDLFHHRLAGTPLPAEGDRDEELQAQSVLKIEAGELQPMQA